MEASGPDHTYDALLRAMPPALGVRARELPFRLGVVPSRDGRWGDFVRLLPNRELPWFAAEHEGQWRLSGEELEHFRQAHHCGGFAGLLSDRLLDGQVESDLGLLELRDVLLNHWIEALGRALRDPQAARRAVSDVLDEMVTAVAQEEALRRTGGMTLRSYAELTRHRLAWIGLSGSALLQSLGEGNRRARFETAHGLFLFALQCIDDVRDAAEDRRLKGCSAAEQLGIPHAALLCTALQSVRAAATEAGAGGFLALETWLRVFAGSLAAGDLPPCSTASRAVARTLIGHIMDACHEAKMTKESRYA